jgi:uracil-DNA glycosylase
MFVGHNFDSIEAHKEAMDQGGEVGTVFWRTLKGFLGVAALDPAGCVFSNALMGLKPGSADGPMPDCKDYRPQCQHFLRRQIEIVRPSTIIVLGDDAAVQLRKARKRDAAGAAIRFEKVMHPSTRPVNQRPNRDEWILAQGQKIAAAMAAHSIPFNSFGVGK